MTRSVYLSWTLAIAGTLLGSSVVTAADWPQWRGPTRNGVGAYADGCVFARNDEEIVCVRLAE